MALPGEVDQRKKKRLDFHLQVQIRYVTENSKDTIYDTMLKHFGTDGWKSMNRILFHFTPLQQSCYIPKHALYATDNVSSCTMKEGAEKRDRTPEIMEERLRKVKDEATRSLREEKLEQHIKQHTQMMKARGEKLKGTSQGEMKKANQDIETVEHLQTKLAKTKGGLPLREYRLTAFMGEFPPRMQTQKIFSSSKF